MKKGVCISDEVGCWDGGEGQKMMSFHSSRGWMLRLTRSGALLSRGLGDLLALSATSFRLRRSWSLLGCRQGCPVKPCRHSSCLSSLQLGHYELITPQTRRSRRSAKGKGRGCIARREWDWRWAVERWCFDFQRSRLRLEGGAFVLQQGWVRRRIGVLEKTC